MLASLKNVYIERGMALFSPPAPVTAARRRWPGRTPGMERARMQGMASGIWRQAGKLVPLAAISALTGRLS